MRASKIIKFDEENGISIVFCAYSFAEDFPPFLDFLKEKLGVTVGPIEEVVYLIIAELQLDNKIFEAIFDDQIGCTIQLEAGWDDFADDIIKKCTV